MGRLGSKPGMRLISLNSFCRISYWGSSAKGFRSTQEVCECNYHAQNNRRHCSSRCGWMRRKSSHATAWVHSIPKPHQYSGTPPFRYLLFGRSNSSSSLLRQVYLLNHRPEQFENEFADPSNKVVLFSTWHHYLVMVFIICRSYDLFYLDCIPLLSCT